ncbi:MAG: hypothetical protein DSY92_03735 [Planctomycetota bacterium]|nr:MAG: hypothetical protein DSY92_03735 [Planctomycetota bacterium]
MNWTAKLIDPIAKGLKPEFTWLRVEEARSGGWYCLSGKKSDPVVNWHHLEEDGTLKKLEAMSDKRLPVMASACSRWISSGYSVQLMAWRVGSRAIFKLRRNHVSCYAKIFRKDRQILERWKHFSGQIPGDLPSVPQIIEWNEKDKILITDERPGFSLHHLWSTGVWMPTHLEVLRSVLELLGSSPAPESLPCHQVADEISILGTRLEVFQRILKRPHAEAEPLVRSTIERLLELDEVEMSLAHRDLHDKQMVVSTSGISLIDLDLLARADPALDRGNIIAHCRLRALQGLPVPWKKVASSIAAESRLRNISPAHLQAWTGATLCRLALIYGRRTRFDGFIKKLFSSLEQLQESRGEWEGLLE